MSVTTPRGQVLRDDDGMRLEFVRTYDDPVEDVWSALTDPDRVARWVGTVSGDPATGAVEFDRLARSVPDARDIVAELATREVKLSIGASVTIRPTRSGGCCSTCWPWWPSSSPT